ncbi:MAG TPA: hypothetical protein VG710_17285, partial [Opitutus sp.]|nr:hypothetical protein [Opitutus sp.]
MASPLSLSRRRRLIRRLQTARQSLAAWDASVRDSAFRTASDAESQTEIFLSLLADARRAVDQRLVELGVADQPPAEPAHFARSKTTPRPPHDADPAMSAYRVCVHACHACGRALGVALREAQAAA